MALPDTIWQGGQITDLPLFTGDLDGTELFEIVAPGDPATGLNYRYTSAQLVAALSKLQSLALVIDTGATLLDPYGVPITPSRFLFKKTVPSETYVEFDSSALYPTPVLIRDIAGNADVYPIHITFFGAETADGLSAVTINTPYGGYFFNPLPDSVAPGWYIGTA